MSDESITARIEGLVAEEHELRTREESDSMDDEALAADQERLRAVEVELDRCWDLLRQRRARPRRQHGRALLAIAPPAKILPALSAGNFSYPGPWANFSSPP